MPNITPRFFSKDHWKHPFTIKVTKPSDPTKVEKTKIGKGKRITAIFLAVISGIFSLGLLAAPVFFLSAFFFKKLELRQRKVTNITNQKGMHQKVPNPPSAGSAKLAASKPSPSPRSEVKWYPNPKVSRQIPISEAPEKTEEFSPPSEDGGRVGLTNVGNTCWVNAVLQWLAGTGVADWLIFLLVNDKLLQIMSTKEQVENFKNDLKNLLDRIQSQTYLSKTDRASLLEFDKIWDHLFRKTDLLKVNKELEGSAALQRDLKKLIASLARSSEFEGEEVILTDSHKALLKNMTENWENLFNSTLISHALKKNSQYKETLLKFQTAFKNLIYTLRTQQGYIGRKDCQAFEKLVTSLMQQDLIAGTGGQMDASEFLLVLQRTFNFPPSDDLNKESQYNQENFVKMLTLYEMQKIPEHTSKPPVYKKPYIGPYEPLIKISVPYEEANLKAPISILHSIAAPDARTVRADFAIKDSPVDTYEDGTPFDTNSYPVNLPKKINVYFSRLVGVEESGSQKFDEEGNPVYMKCERSYEIDAQGCIQLIEYNRDTVGMNEGADSNLSTQDGSEPWKILPNRTCTYEISAAILHEGSATSGHYVMLQKITDKQYLYFSDTTVKFISSEEALDKIRKEATVMHFKLV
ncbi:hypothetical protein [Parachlamydia sp. AcF125]|uniref:hypothetical protein n=1 Tax=Parachlamydia sp. AcF125 TaxID=2795736 RepID=UPI001BC8DF60|nr:hypothetical protein [Parachlamydia sp. AcF125]MBS4168783.1 hypothetical protein [Parachlamydia sp. AcF125]